MRFLLNFVAQPLLPVRSNRVFNKYVEQAGPQSSPVLA
jgi:hypothetical protein